MPIRKNLNDVLLIDVEVSCDVFFGCVIDVSSGLVEEGSDAGDRV
jgi:hypothetical protein